jgi:hypothetical protein
MEKETYTQSREQTPVDWNRIIDNRLNNLPDGINQRTLNIWANDWVTCACGNQCAIIPRSSSGTPMDDKLEELGIDFAHYVRGEDWVEARHTLALIEIRSIVLIERIENAVKLKNEDHE